MPDCFAAACTERGTQLCTGCRVAHYCSVACQRAHRQIHRPACELKDYISLLPLDMHVLVASNFSMRDACALRLVSPKFKDAVSAHLWDDKRSVIMGSLAAWRASFPKARSANVSSWDPNHPRSAAHRRAFGPTMRIAPLLASEFQHLRNLRWLSASGSATFTDGALLHLGSTLTRLHVEGCPALTGANMAHIGGTPVLFMAGCSEHAIRAAKERGLAVVAPKNSPGIDAYRYCSQSCMPEGLPDQ